MKILQIVPTLDLQSGGPVQAVQELSEQLAEKGVRVTISATRNSQKQKTTPLSQKISCQLFPSWGPKNFAFSPSFQRAMRGDVKNFDLVHIHTLWSFPAAIASYYCRKYHIPYVIRPCGMLDSYCLSHHSLRKKIYGNLIEKRNLNGAHAVQFTTQEEKNRSKRYIPDSKGVVIPLGIKMENDSNLPTKGEFRKHHPHLNGKKIILFLGRINFKKGLDLLVNAFSRIIKTVREVHWIIAGPDEEGYGSQLKRWIHQKGIEEQVTLTGFVGDEKKRALLRDSDIFCLPSYQENFGLAVVEAMAAGLPVVVSNQVNIYHEIQAAQAGFVTLCDADEIAFALRRLLQDESLRKSMGQNGQRLVREKYQWDTIVEKMIQLYEGIAHNHSR